MFTRSNIPGWALFEVLTSAQMNALDIDHANAIDGAGGGTYAPTVKIMITGTGTKFHVTAGTVLDDTSFTGDVFFENGFNVNDNLTVNDQGDLEVDGDSQFDGDVEINGNLTVNDVFPVFLHGLNVDNEGIISTTLITSVSLTTSGDLSVGDDAVINGDLSVVGLATLTTLLCGPAIMGQMQVNEKLTFNSHGRPQYRLAVAGDADATYSVNDYDRVHLPDTVSLSANRTWYIDEVGAENGMEIMVVARPSLWNSKTITVRRLLDNGILATLDGSTLSWLKVVRVAGGWKFAERGLG